MKYLVMFKGEEANIESSEGATISESETDSSIIIKSKENKIEYYIPLDSLLYIKAVFSEEKEGSDEDEKEYPAEDERIKAIDAALKKFFNL